MNNSVILVCMETSSLNVIALPHCVQTKPDAFELEFCWKVRLCYLSSSFFSGILITPENPEAFSSTLVLLSWASTKLLTLQYFLAADVTLALRARSKLFFSVSRKLFLSPLKYHGYTSGTQVACKQGR